MSSFQMKAKHRVTREVHDIWCLDDYFGKHQYGYIHNEGERTVYNEETFNWLYEPIKEQNDTE